MTKAELITALATVPDAADIYIWGHEAGMPMLRNIRVLVQDNADMGETVSHVEILDVDDTD